MSTNFDAPKTYDSSNQIEKWENNISKLPSNIKEQVTQKTVDEIDKLKEDMQKISYDKFLGKDHKDRLKFITDPHVDSKNVTENTTIEFNFSFTSEEINDDLYLLTTAGQVLPNTVKTIIWENGKQYSRESLCWEFFAEDGKRLVIHDKTQITIWETRTPDQIAQLEKQAEESLQNVDGITDQNRELFSMSASKWIDPKLLLWLFSAFFTNKEFSDVPSWEYEDFLTQVDREIGYMNMDEKRADKNNLSQESQDELLDRMWNQSAMESLNHENIEIWSHRRFLDFISKAEGTHNNYEAIFSNGTQQDIKITQMSLREVLHYQQYTLLPTAWHTPVGKYQFNKETLEDYIDRFGFSLDQKMNVDFQDKIAMIKMKESGLDDFQSWKLSQKDFEKNIAWTWAGFPKDASGKSYYDWIAWNRAQVAYNDYSQEISYLKWASA